jgi:adhesin transport system membrane fusion protein
MSEPLVADGAISDVEILRLKRSVNDIQVSLKRASWRFHALLRQTKKPDKIADLEIKFRIDARSELSTARPNSLL